MPPSTPEWRLIPLRTRGASSSTLDVLGLALGQWAITPHPKAPPGAQTLSQVTLIPTGARVTQAKGVTASLAPALLEALNTLPSYPFPPDFNVEENLKRVVLSVGAHWK